MTVDVSRKTCGFGKRIVDADASAASVSTYTVGIWLTGGREGEGTSVALAEEEVWSWSRHEVKICSEDEKYGHFQEN